MSDIDEKVELIRAHVKAQGLGEADVQQMVNTVLSGFEIARMLVELLHRPTREETLFAVETYLHDALEDPAPRNPLRSETVVAERLREMIISLVGKMYNPNKEAMLRSLREMDNRQTAQQVKDIILHGAPLPTPDDEPDAASSP